MFGRTYVFFLTFDPDVFVLAQWSTLSQTSLNRIFWSSDLYPSSKKLNCSPLRIILQVQLKLTGVHFLFK